VAIVGREAAEQVFLTQHPATYLSVLKERATHQVYRKLIRYFYPENDTELDDILMNYRSRKDDTDGPDVALFSDKKRRVLEFQRSFERGYFFARMDDMEFKWLLWLQETVLKSLESSNHESTSLTTITDLISISTEFTLEQLFVSTATSRPYRWVDDILVSSIIKAMTQLQQLNADQKKSIPVGDNQQSKRQIWALTSDLQKCLRSEQLNGRLIIEIILRKLE
jgi:hypothetical protein